VARRCADGGSRGGGEGIQAPRPRRARVATGVVALLAAAGLAAYPAAQDIDLHELALGLGGLALALLAFGLFVGWAGALGCGLALLGGEYAVLFAAEGATLDRLTPVYAAGFMFVAEVAFWSIERRVPAWSEAATLEWRLGHLGAACAGAAGVGALATVSAAAATGGGGVVLESFGVGAAIGSIVILAALMRRLFLR
jgi:hypothetical protein